MPCFHPLTAWKSANLQEDFNALTKKHRLVFKADLGFPNTKTEIACGQCAGCRLDKARAWAIRCVHEASLHKENCFLTLTYNDNNLPDGGSLNVRDIQLFLKRLRKKCGPFRFFQCGEYGELLNRPHHHILLFGLNFPDKLLFRSGKENKLYSSATVSALWTYGFHSIGELTFDSACYCARYVLKKFTGDSKDEYYQGRKPEYITMSRRPGIATEWYNRYKSDIYNHDKCVVKGQFIARPPSFYDRMYEQENPDHFQQLKIQRAIRAKENPDNTPTRREQLEEFTTYKQQKIPRPLEGYVPPT